MCSRRLSAAILALLTVCSSSGFGYELDAPTFDKIKSAWSNLLDAKTDYSMVIELRDGSGVNVRTEHLIRKGEAGAAVNYFSNTMMALYLLNEKYAAQATNLKGDGKAGLGELRRDGWELRELVLRSPETNEGKLSADVSGVAGPIPFRGPWESLRYMGLLETNANSLHIEQQQNGGVRVRIDKNSPDNHAWQSVQSAEMELEGAPHYQLKQLSITDRDGKQSINLYTYTMLEGVPYLASSSVTERSPDGVERKSSVDYRYLPASPVYDSIFTLSTYGLEEPGAAPPEPKNELGKGALVMLLLVGVAVAVVLYRKTRRTAP